MSRAGQALGPIALALLAGLASSCRLFPGQLSDREGPDPAFRLLGEDPARMTLQRPSAEPGSAYRYLLHREDAGITEALHAVALDTRVAFAAGEHGVVVRRGRADGWTVERSGTDRTLRALAIDDTREAPRGVEEDAIEDPPILAVGDGGTVLRRSPRGTWSAEPSGTTRDLFAVSADPARVIAAGAGGTLIARRPDGIWYPIATPTEATLFAVVGRPDGDVVVGQGGAVIACGAWKQAVHGQPACVAARAPGTDDLVGVVVDEDHALWALSARGTMYRAAERGVPAFAKVTRWAPRRADAVYGGLAQVSGELCAVGARGSVLFAAPDGTSEVSVAGAPELTAAAQSWNDGFLVGERGAIVHARVEGGRGVVMYAVQQ